MIAAVVLAAGKSARLGLPKPLLPAGPGETLLTRALGVAAAAVDGPVIPVIGSEADLMLAELERWRAGHENARPRLRHVVNGRFEEGLSTSLRAGIAEAGEADGVLVLLTDQPGVDAARAADLVDRFRKKSAGIAAVAASWGGEQRTPVVLGRSLFAAVAGLAGDEGARRVLRSRPEEVERVDWGAGPWQTDVDTWDAYVSFARQQGWDRESPGGAGESASVATPAPGVAGWAALAASQEPPTERLSLLRRLVLTALGHTI